ncbi:hypothetical protein OIU79_007713 [Salix purpurea]|uniref:Uncharacterized protein n=1 Tax=Salix purpurea TaxID=77065 RepID=A0A9Q0YV89_SALPP|nr:hypothetical protein OIU79_007713 [Salix purpurea]
MDQHHLSLKCSLWLTPPIDCQFLRPFSETSNSRRDSTRSTLRLQTLLSSSGPSSCPFAGILIHPRDQYLPASGFNL